MAVVLRGGHSGSVLCCDVLKDESGRILTGGECGEINLWNCDGDKLGYVTIENGEDDVTSIFALKTKPDLLYCSVLQDVFLYDIRQFREPIEKLAFNEDEINQITLNDKEEYLASCNDSGNVKIYSLIHKNVFKTLRKHTNICSSVAFRPKRPWDLFSGGYDHRLLQWDFSRAKAVCDINIEEVGVPPEKFDSYVVNPPFIHSIAVSLNGAFLACGTDNALVQIFSASKRTPQYVKTLRGHSQSVSQVHFPHFAENTLISGGSDGICNIWKLDDLNSSPLTNGFHHDSDDSSAHTSNSQQVGTAAEADSSSSGSSPDNQSVTSHQESPTSPSLSPRPCFGIHHAEKVNWITSGCSANRKFIIVADVSNEATVYSYPDS